MRSWWFSSRDKQLFAMIITSVWTPLTTATAHHKSQVTPYWLKLSSNHYYFICLFVCCCVDTCFVYKCMMYIMCHFRRMLWTNTHTTLVELLSLSLIKIINNGGLCQYDGWCWKKLISNLFPHTYLGIAVFILLKYHTLH